MSCKPGDEASTHLDPMEVFICPSKLGVTARRKSELAIVALFDKQRLSAMEPLNGSVLTQARFVECNTKSCRN